MSAWLAANLLEAHRSPCCGAIFESRQHACPLYSAPNRGDLKGMHTVRSGRGGRIRTGGPLRPRQLSHIWRDMAGDWLQLLLVEPDSSDVCRVVDPCCSQMPSASLQSS